MSRESEWESEREIETEIDNEEVTFEHRHENKTSSECWERVNERVKEWIRKWESVWQSEWESETDSDNEEVKDWLLSIAMKTKVVQHLERLKHFNLELTHQKKLVEHVQMKLFICSALTVHLTSKLENVTTWQQHLTYVTFEHRNENKSCSASLKDQTWQLGNLTTFDMCYWNHNNTLILSFSHDVTNLTWISLSFRHIGNSVKGVQSVCQEWLT